MVTLITASRAGEGGGRVVVGGGCHETIFLRNGQRRLAYVMHGSVGEIFNLGACLSAVRERQQVHRQL